MRRQRWRALIVVGVAVLGGRCDNNQSTTAPTAVSETTTSSATAPTITEYWTGVVPVGGAAFYSFSSSQQGTVAVTLEQVGGPFVPSTVALGVGIGTPDGPSCATTSTAEARAGSSPQLSGTFDPGTYCVSVSDVGNLFAPATVSVSIAHP